MSRGQCEENVNNPFVTRGQILQRYLMERNRLHVEVGELDYIPLHAETLV